MSLQAILSGIGREVTHHARTLLGKNHVFSVGIKDVGIGSHLMIAESDMKHTDVKPYLSPFMLLWKVKHQCLLTKTCRSLLCNAATQGVRNSMDRKHIEGDMSWTVIECLIREAELFPRVFLLLLFQQVPLVGPNPVHLHKLTPCS